VAALTLSCVSLVGWSGLRVNTDFLSYFPENTSIRRHVDDFHQSLGGGVLFYVVVDTGSRDGATEPAVLRTVAELQEFLMATGKVDKTVSVADFLRTMHREMNGGDRAFDVIPPTRELVAQYLLLLEGTDLSRYLDFEASSLNIVVNHHVRSSWELAALLAQLDVFVTGDTGPMHLAAAVGAPVVAVFGPSNPDRYAPRDPIHRIVRIDLPCSPCNRIRLPPERCAGHIPDCLTGIDVEMVYQAVESVLDSRQHRVVRAGSARG
jgi:hypothetical protein